MAFNQRGSKSLKNAVKRIVTDKGIITQDDIHNGQKISETFNNSYTNTVE